METLQDLIPIGRAAKLIGVTYACIKYYIRTGRLNVVYVVERPTVRRSEVERLIADRGAHFPHPGRPLRKLEAKNW
jgi:hypothetical protein